jgi:type VI protein secretion system component Hcp
MPIDGVSTNLLRDVLESRSLTPVEVVFRLSNGTPYLTYDFTNCFVTSYQLQDGPGTQPQETSGAPSVQVTFVFQGIKLSFGNGVAGTVTTGWSITTNKAA